jgi:hypothetical protein
LPQDVLRQVRVFSRDCDAARQGLVLAEVHADIADDIANFDKENDSIATFCDF